MFVVIKISTHSFPVLEDLSQQRKKHVIALLLKNKKKQKSFVDPILFHHPPFIAKFCRRIICPLCLQFLSSILQTGPVPLPAPPLTCSQSLWSPMTSMVLQPAVNFQSSSYLASQQLITVHHFLLLEICVHLGFWGITGTWFSISFLHWSAPRAPSNFCFLSVLPP